MEKITYEGAHQTGEWSIKKLTDNCEDSRYHFKYDSETLHVDTDLSWRDATSIRSALKTIAGGKCKPTGILQYND